MKTLSENIKNFRTMRGLTQTDLAVLLHRSVGAISNWEKGTNSPDVDTLEELCKILKVTPNEIYGWDENQELADYMVELDNARIMIETIKKERASTNETLRAYAEKFGKLLNK